MPTQRLRRNNKRSVGHGSTGPVHADASVVVDGLTLDPPPPGSFYIGASKHTSGNDKEKSAGAAQVGTTPEKPSADSTPMSSTNVTPLKIGTAPKTSAAADGTAAAAAAGHGTSLPPSAAPAHPAPSTPPAGPVAAVPAGPSVEAAHDDAAREEWALYLRIKQAEEEAAHRDNIAATIGKEGAQASTPQAATPPFETVRSSRVAVRTSADTEAGQPVSRPAGGGQAALLERLKLRGIQPPPVASASEERLWSEDPSPSALRLRSIESKEESPFPTPSAVSLASQHNGPLSQQRSISTSRGPSQLNNNDPAANSNPEQQRTARSESFRTAEASPAPHHPASSERLDEEGPATTPPQRLETEAAAAAAASSPPGERCFFIVSGLAGHSRVKLKLAPDTELASLFSYYFGKVQAPLVVQQKSFFMWNGLVLDPKRTPLDYKMGTSVANVNTVRIMPKRDPAVLTPSSAAAIVSGPRATGGDSVEQVTELQLQLQCAQAKADLLEFQLKKKTSQGESSSSVSAAHSQPPPAHQKAPAQSSSQSKGDEALAAVGKVILHSDGQRSSKRHQHAPVPLPSADIDDIHEDDGTPTPREVVNGTAGSAKPGTLPHRASQEILQSHVTAEKELIEAAKRRSAREYAKEKQQEAAYWKQQFECAMQELAMVKVLVAQQAAALDRLGVPTSPFPDSIVGSAFVHKSYSFDGSVAPCFAPM